jgi:hypothetical protein
VDGETAKALKSRERERDIRQLPKTTTVLICLHKCKHCKDLISTRVKYPYEENFECDMPLSEYTVDTFHSLNSS